MGRFDGRAEQEMPRDTDAAKPCRAVAVMMKMIELDIQSL